MFNQHYLQKVLAASHQAENTQPEAAQKKRNDTRSLFKKVKANTTSQATQTTATSPAPDSTNANQGDRDRAVQEAYQAGLQAGRESRTREGIATGFGMSQMQMDWLEGQRDTARNARDRAAELLADATGDLTRLQHVNALLAHTVHVVAAERDVAAAERDALRVQVQENNE